MRPTDPTCLVMDAKHLGNYRLWLRFSDGTAGEVDLADLILNDKRPIVTELRDAASFAAFTINLDTVAWKNGFDLAPEYLHALVKAAAATWNRTASKRVRQTRDPTAPACLPRHRSCKRT